MTKTLMPPTVEDIFTAARLLKGKIVQTPLLQNNALNKLTGGRILLKAECLQITGSFKYRGAYHFLRRLCDEVSEKPTLVAYSSGNHAQAVAAAAGQFGLPVVIVMPADAPQVKIQRTKAFGAEVVLYDRAAESREAIAHEIASQRHGVIVPPYDHPWTIAGQGTCALEMIEQVEALEEVMDAVLIPCSGGGLTAGCALAINYHSPYTEIYPVEPAGFDDTTRSLEAGDRLSNAPHADSICDALLMSQPGEITFPINQSLCTGGLVVSDDLVRQAVAFAFRELKLVVEPGGAVGLAAVFGGLLDCDGKTIVVILSGGNVDHCLFCNILANVEPGIDEQ